MRLRKNLFLYKTYLSHEAFLPCGTKKSGRAIARWMLSLLLTCKTGLCCFPFSPFFSRCTEGLFCFFRPHLDNRRISIAGKKPASERQGPGATMDIPSGAIHGYPHTGPGSLCAKTMQVSATILPHGLPQTWGELCGPSTAIPHSYERPAGASGNVPFPSGTQGKYDGTIKSHRPPVHSLQRVCPAAISHRVHRTGFSRHHRFFDNIV